MTVFFRRPHSNFSHRPIPSHAKRVYLATAKILRAGAFGFLAFMEVKHRGIVRGKPAPVPDYLLKEYRDLLLKMGDTAEQAQAKIDKIVSPPPP